MKNDHSFNLNVKGLTYIHKFAMKCEDAVKSTCFGRQLRCAEATKTSEPMGSEVRMVREGGVEPPLHHWNTDLNRARLPIPPLARAW